MAEPTTCPVCGEPVGNDPHSECFESHRSEYEGNWSPPEEPFCCPACGAELKDMECGNPACELNTLSS